MPVFRANRELEGTASDGAPGWRTLCASLRIWSPGVPMRVSRNRQQRRTGRVLGGYMASFQMKRRSFLKGVAATGAGLCAPAAMGAAFTAPSATRCLVQESGSCSNWPLVIGALVTNSLDRRNAELDELRRATGYRRQIRHNATDEARIPFGRALIDYFIQDDGIRFRALILDDELGTWPRSPAERDARYLARYADLLDDGAINLAVSIGIPTRKNRRSAFLHGALRSIASETEVERLDAAVSNMAQLAALLAGCVRADKTVAAAKGRNDLLRHFKTRLGVRDLTTLALDKAAVRSTNI